MTDKSNKEQRNSLLAIFFLAILAVMLIPMPPLMLDAMLCLNITVSLLILMPRVMKSCPNGSRSICLLSRCSSRS